MDGGQPTLIGSPYAVATGPLTALNFVENSTPNINGMSAQSEDNVRLK